MKFSEKLNDYIEQLSCTEKISVIYPAFLRHLSADTETANEYPSLEQSPLRIYAVRWHRFPHKKESYKSPLTL